MTKLQVTYQKAKYRVFKDRLQFVARFPVKIVYYRTDLLDMRAWERGSDKK